MPPKETPTSCTRNRQRQKLDRHPDELPSWFWDNLSRQWLTPRALREFDRRTAQPTVPLPPDLPDFELQGYPAQVKRFARQGGPSLSDLRAVRSIRICPEMTL